MLAFLFFERLASCERSFVSSLFIRLCGEEDESHNLNANNKVVKYSDIPTSHCICLAKEPYLVKQQVTIHQLSITLFLCFTVIYLSSVEGRRFIRHRFPP